MEPSRSTAKVPVSSGALLSAGVGLQLNSIDATISSNGLSGSDSGSQTAFGTSVGFSVFF